MIRRIRVSGGFLDGLDVELSPGLNCIIGGRGTGKTTLLELVRYAFAQDLPGDEAKAKLVSSLVGANLGAGRVTVDFATAGGESYSVTRGAGDQPIVRDAGGSATGIDISKGTLSAPSVYSQGEIERIAETPEQQLALLDAFAHADVRATLDAIRQIKHNLRANGDQLQRLREEGGRLDDILAERPEVQAALQAIEPALAELPAALEEEAERRSARRRASETGNELRESLIRLHVEASMLASSVPTEETVRSAAALMRDAYPSVPIDEDGLVRDTAGALARIEQASEALSAAAITIVDALKAAGAADSAAEEKYQQLVARHAQHRELAQRQQDLKERLQKLDGSRKLREQASEALRESSTERAGLLAELGRQRDRLFAARHGVATRLTDSLGPKIRVGVEQFGITTAYHQFLMQAMQRSGLRYASIVETTVSRVPPEELAAIVRASDVERLANLVGIQRDRATSFVAHLADSRAADDLELVDLQDRPSIELLQANEYRATPRLSTGEKCTTILPILLLGDGGTLLIDQPEDNLDNAFVFDVVVNQIQNAKQNRQLVFITHNPNIPVLGEAERVIVLEADGAHGWATAAGTVDEARGHIVSLLEGGEDAFKRRQLKYGY